VKNENENQIMKNEKTLVFTNEIKLKKEVEGNEENPSLQTKFSRFLIINEKNL
jgi:hypothetical protein